MVGYRVSIMALFFFASLISPMGFAKSVSLKTIEVSLNTEYGVLDTEIHFDKKDLAVALKVEKIIKTDLIKVINYFKYVPRNTVHFNIDPYLRLTNGNARVFPTDIINLYKFPPDNNDHLITLEDWLTGLVFHEYIHITHLDQTDGFLDVGRQIFGSIAKIPANIVPRWFTEGIAVWGESHLMKGGRLNNPLFRKELLVQFLRVEYCKTIDCLDDPGVYPNGQLAYWAGAHFMEFLENKKPGTIKCMVEANSGSFPFSLNSVFYRCAGSEAQFLFSEFRESIINSQPKQTAEDEAWGDKISNIYGSDDLQKGIYLDGNTLFKVERDRESEVLTSYDLQENVNMVVTKYRHHISDIAGITTVPGADLEQSDNGKFLIVSFNEDPNYRTNNRVWKLINTETLLIESVLDFKNDPSYVAGLGDHNYITASFVDNKWVIEKQNTKAQTSQVLHQLGSDVNLIYFKKKGQKIFLKLNRKDIGSALYVADLSLEKLYKIYESNEVFDLPVVSENVLVIREKDKLKMVEFTDGLKKVSMGDLNKDLLNRVTSVELNDERVLVLENRLKTKAMTMKESMGYLKKSASKVTAVDLSQASFKDEELPKNESKVESFPKFYHMLPHYWFFAAGSSENLSSIGAMTTFSDPMDLNVLNTTVLSYPSVSKVGGNLDFVHKLSYVSDLWSMSAFFNHEYSKTDYSDYLNQTTETVLGTHYAFLMKRWTFMPGLYAGTTKTRDFISERTVETIGTNSILNYSASSFDDYFQSLNLRTKFQNDRPKVGDDYINMQAVLDLEGRFYERLVGGIKTSYGKLVKSGFQQGVLYAGGTSSLNTRRWHEFYGIPYSNAYGNEIFTFRVFLDYNMWYVYRGRQFLPIFLKEVHLLLGRETMYADRIILSNVRYTDETIHSFFIGPRFKTNVFYFVPVDFDVIYSNIAKPKGGSVNQVQFDIGASF